MLKPEHRLLIRRHYKELATFELIDLILETYGDVVTSDDVSKFKSKHKLHDAATRYKVRSQPRQESDPRNSPVGSERENKGYTMVKVAHPNVWRMKSQVIWEEHHKKPIPEGHRMQYKDGNPSNLDIDNLHPVPMRVSLTRHRFGLNSNEPELFNTEILLTEIKLAIFDRKKKERK